MNRNYALIVRKINADLPERLAQLSKILKFTLVYISTGTLLVDEQSPALQLDLLDYVFDGTSPPYTPSARTNPLQLYGQTKRDGEVAVLGVDDAKVVVLRVPVLYVSVGSSSSHLAALRHYRLTIYARYGPAPQNSDSAINILLDVVQDQSGKQYKMDHYATRYPTNVVDIANFLVRLSSEYH